MDDAAAWYFPGAQAIGAAAQGIERPPERGGATCGGAINPSGGVITPACTML